MSTYDSIASAAFKLFYQHGFHATGVEQLSHAAGVTKKTLYRHFASKDVLVNAVLTRRDQEFMQKLRTAVEAKPIAARPYSYIDFIVNWVQEEDFFGCAFINAAAEYSQTDAPVQHIAKEHKAKILSYLEQLCSEAKLPEASSIAQQLFLLGEGLIVASQTKQNMPALINSAKSLAATLTHLKRV